MPFAGGVVKVAKGSNVQLKVAAGMAPAAKVVPQQCTIYYRDCKRPTARAASGAAS